MNIEYIKNYRDKELRHYILAYLIICISSVGLNVSFSPDILETLTSVFKMLMTDALLCAVCVLASIINEIWSDSVKTRLVYWVLPSNTIFTDIARNKFKESGVDIEMAKKRYVHLKDLSPHNQTAEWNKLLRKCKEGGQNNVIDAQRTQLMMRDMCLSTISLLVMTIAVMGILFAYYKNIGEVWGVMGFPIAYLVIMIIVTRIAAKNRANRLVSLVIKNDVQDMGEGKKQG